MKLLSKPCLASVLFLFGLTLTSHAQVQCAIDVEIAEGDTIEMCANALVPLNASGGFVAYIWSGSNPGATQQNIPTASGQHIVFAEDAIGCISTDTIEVIVFPFPADAIISSAGATLCNGGSSTLSLSNAYTSYAWTGGFTTPTIDVSQSGTYNVGVEDNNGCVAAFSFSIDVINFDLQIVSQNSCDNTQALLASGGTTYNWSTGESSNIIVVSPETTTTYDVTITEGSCVSNLSISVDPITSSTANFSIQDTFFIEAGESLLILGPSGFDSYVWSPGDQLLDSTMSSVTFEGTETQTITLTATHADGCVFEATFTVVVVNLTVPDGFSPNADLINDFFEIPELIDYQGSLVVWNRWGDIVFEAADYQNDWDGTCLGNFCFPNGGPLTDGTYFYHLDVGGITKEGFITLIR